MSPATEVGSMAGNVTTVLLIVAGVFLAISLGFLLWALDAMPASDEALEFLKSTSEVDVLLDGGDIFFIPKVDPKFVGLILYPGGRVDHRAYAPLVFKLAQNGYHGVILKVPLNLAFLRVSGADEVLERYPSVRWFVAGHSLGGVAASEYFKDKHGRLEGLIMLASYPASDLSRIEGKKVLVLFGTNDGLVTRENVERSKGLLPKSAQFVSIEGGNHSQFGYYGFQNGDGEATLTREEQQKLVLREIVALLGSVR